jgi:hypothetical protein
MPSLYGLDSPQVCNTSRCDLALVRWAGRRSAAKVLTKRQGAADRGESVLLRKPIEPAGDNFPDCHGSDM